MSPDLVVSCHVLQKSGGLDARSVVPDSVALNGSDPGFVQGDPLLDL